METTDVEHQICSETEQSMEKALGHVAKELSGLRTGKATPSLVDSILVEAYGGNTRLKDVAGISAPEPRLLIVQPWDISIMDNIVKAIGKANVGVTPMKDGKIIRIPIPELSAQRREELKKLGKKMAEEGRVAVRNVRRDINEKIKKHQKDSKITEDQKHHLEKRVQDTTDKYIKKIDTALENKEKELDQ
jgi:ribosome recycling factor